MKIEMLQTTLGQDVGSDGASLPQQSYIAGTRYTVGESLGKTFFELGVAIEVIEKPVPEPAPTGADVFASAPPEPANDTPPVPKPAPERVPLERVVPKRIEEPKRVEPKNKTPKKKNRHDNKATLGAPANKKGGRN